MIKKIVLLIYLSLSTFCFSQNDNLYILVEEPFYVVNENNITTEFGIKSEDKRFNLDFYRFQVSNFQGLDEKGKNVYHSLSELKEEVNLDSINSMTIEDLRKNHKWWEIHNFLSLKKDIYVVEKSKGKWQQEKNSFSYLYFSIPVEYLGTTKNMVPTDFSRK